MAGVKSRSRVYCSVAALNRGHSAQPCLQAFVYVQNVPRFMFFLATFPGIYQNYKMFCHETDNEMSLKGERG